MSDQEDQFPFRGNSASSVNGVERFSKLLSQGVDERTFGICATSLASQAWMTSTNQYLEPLSSSSFLKASRVDYLSAAAPTTLSAQVGDLVCGSIDLPSWRTILGLDVSPSGAHILGASARAAHHLFGIDISCMAHGLSDSWRANITSVDHLSVLPTRHDGRMLGRTDESIFAAGGALSNRVATLAPNWSSLLTSPTRAIDVLNSFRVGQPELARSFCNPSTAAFPSVAGASTFSAARSTGLFPPSGLNSALPWPTNLYSPTQANLLTGEISNDASILAVKRCGTSAADYLSDIFAGPEFGHYFPTLGYRSLVEPGDGNTGPEPAICPKKPASCSLSATDIVELRDFLNKEGGDEPADSVATSMYSLLRAFERWLRRLIDRLLSKEFGPHWIDCCVASETRDVWAAKRERDVKSGRQPEPLLTYADFTDYVAIIQSNKNWAVAFKGIPARRDDIIETLRRLQPIRNPTMHARNVTSEDERDLMHEIRRFVRAFAQAC